MKLITIIALMFVTITNQAFAEEMPEYMKDGKITVTLKDGKSYTFSTNEYMVVKRHAKKEVTPAAPTATAVAQQPKEEKQAHKYRLTALVGYGYTGKLNDETTKSTVDVTQDKGVIGGLAGQIDLNKDYHLMGEVLTNQSFLLGIGKGF